MKLRSRIGPLRFQAGCRKRRLNLALVFAARRNARIASAVLATAIPTVRPFVCPSVCLSHAGIVLKRLHVARYSLHSDRKMCLVF